MKLRVVTMPQSQVLECTGGYRCTCEACELERKQAMALAGQRDKPQPWAALERAA